MAAVWALVGPDPRPRESAAMRGGFAASMLEVLGTPVLWPFNLSVLVSYGGYFARLTWLPTFLVESEGLGPAGAGVITALITAGTIVSWPLAGPLSPIASAGGIACFTRESGGRPATASGSGGSC
jgi:nitrate/nitrite transporter NarK